MTDEERFNLLMEACRRRDPEALAELVRLCIPYLHSVVRKKLHDNLRRWFDSVDFTQDVWSSFFRAAIDRDIQSEEGLLIFLATLARNKITEEIRRHNTQRLGGDWEREIVALETLPARDPTPSTPLASKDEWDKVLRRLSPKQRQMLEMLRTGYTYDEVAAKFGIPSKSLQRLIRWLSKKHNENPEAP